MDLRVVLDPPGPAANNPAEDEAKTSFFAGGEALQLEEGTAEAGPKRLPGAGMLGSPHQGGEFLLSEKNRGGVARTSGARLG